MPTLNNGLPSAGKIMVVDDNPANLNLLERMLREQGYDVRSFRLGRLALSAAQKEAPDLILLDVNMPEMDGYEVCRRLKSDETLSEIPVIFISALNAAEDKLRGFRSGGADYVSKPFRLEEVNARVKAHVGLHRMRRSLQSQNDHLEDLVASRTLELKEANHRLSILDRTKSDFLRLIAHEFSTPLNGLLGIGELILSEISSTPDFCELERMFHQSRRRIVSMLDDALFLTQIDITRKSFSHDAVAVSEGLRLAIVNTTQFAESRNVLLSPFRIELGLTLADQDLMVRAFAALLETAVKFSSDGECVKIVGGCDADSIHVIITSSGRSIPEDELGRFFDIFAVCESATPGGDIGLRPPVARSILSLFGASVDVANRAPSGIQLTVRLKSFRP